MSELVCRTLKLLAESKDAFASAVKNIFDTKTMATIKISDLSVGDWVRVINQFDAQIDGYHSGSGSLSLKTRQGNLVYYRLEDIHFIPITAEILEKNGFERPDKKVYLDTWSWTNKEDTMIELAMYKDKAYIRVVRFEDGIQRDRDCNFGLNYIHQLQNALRLAGVDKEINL
jgi:hypothetical protein